jgi:FixJ family two-component response regulator
MVEYGMSDAPLIAIVDDDVMVCEATKDLVETFGFNARTFTSAGEFLDSDCVSGASCLIADVQMPRTSGLQLHRTLIASGRHIPVIFITAFPDERVRKRALRAGAVCYLSKPFDGDSLRSCILSAIPAPVKSGKGGSRTISQPLKRLAHKAAPNCRP